MVCASFASGDFPMAREIWSALSGGIRALNQLDRTANNLANVNTAGYKADRPVFKVRMADGAEGVTTESAVGRLAQQFATLEEDRIDFTQGHLQGTGGELDLAISGDGFFRVDAGDERILLTRNGAFRRDPDGTLVTQMGHRVTDRNGAPIRVPPGVVSITREGEILVDGEGTGRVGVWQVADPRQIEKVGGNLFTVPKDVEPEPTEVDVLQGHLEASNVEPVRAIVDLIATQRYYEAFQKTVQTVSELDRELHSRVGSLTA
jgi:flagellar basal-body rod protein FlgG